METFPPPSPQNTNPGDGPSGGGTFQRWFALAAGLASRHPGWIIGSILLVVVLVVFGGLLLETGAGLFLSHFVDTLGRSLGLDRYMTMALTVLLASPLAMAVKIAFFSFKPAYQKKLARRTLIALPVVYFLALSFTRGQDSFDIDRGEAQRWFARTPDGVKYFNHGGWEPKYGVELEPVTKDNIRELEMQVQGGMRRVDLKSAILFNPTTGAPQTWFYRNPNGGLEVFDTPGFHPGTGQQLLPMTHEVAAELRKLGNIDQATRGEIHPIDPTTAILFDPTTGKALVWFYRSQAGVIELYAKPGFHPETGAELKLITAEVAQELRDQMAREKNHGQPGETHPIDPTTAVLFDPATGKPQAWFYRYPDGHLDLFDRPGFHPGTGAELKPITQEMALELRKRPAKQPIQAESKPAPPPVQQASLLPPIAAPRPAPKPVDEKAAAERAAAERERAEHSARSASYDTLKRDAREQLAYKEKFMADAERLGVDFNQETKRAVASVRAKLGECDSAFRASIAADEKACIPGLKRAIDDLRALR